MKTFSIARLHECFLYMHDTGWLIRRLKSHWSNNAGERAGTVNVHGYRQVWVCGVLLLEHRVIWAMCTGAWPQTQIDHINGNKSDNRMSNLRLATASQNSRNVKMHARNLLGVKGVSINMNGRKRYRVRIMVGRKSIRVGEFDSLEEASAAYAEAALKHHGEFARAA